MLWKLIILLPNRKEAFCSRFFLLFRFCCCFPIATGALDVTIVIAEASALASFAFNLNRLASKTVIVSSDCVRGVEIRFGCHRAKRYTLNREVEQVPKQVIQASLLPYRTQIPNTGRRQA